MTAELRLCCTRQPRSMCNPGRVTLALSIALAALVTRPANAQDAAPASAPPLAPLEAGAPAAGEAQAAPPAPIATVSPEAAQLESVRGLTRELLELERRSQEVELERSRVRLTGVIIGKYVSWGVAAMLLSSSLSAFGRAEAVKQALKDGRDDEYYDTNRDGDVDRDDERRSRSIARGLVIGSLVPIGLGVFATVLERKRRHQRRDLTYQLDDMAARRRSLVSRLGAQVGVSAQHAMLQLRMTF